jgi:hypothetical protein
VPPPPHPIPRICTCRPRLPCISHFFV